MPKFGPFRGFCLLFDVNLSKNSILRPLVALLPDVSVECSNTGSPVAYYDSTYCVSESALSAVVVV